MASRLSLISVFFLFGLTLPSLCVSAKLLLEEGYTVTTVINGHKMGINPHAILPRPGSSDFLVLDSSGSSIYTVYFRSSPDSVVVNLLSGDPAHADYRDGELGSAWFNHPRSFAVDLKGNVYVGDKNNKVIRKITNSGVTTIAGGYSQKDQKEGHDDGPAQNATFSNAFDLFFVPEMCALMIADHGNVLVRRIDLKPEDCKRTSKSALGAASGWVVALLSCLLGIVVGIALRSYIIPSEGHSLSVSKTWKHCLISLERQLLTLFCASRNAVASFVIYALVRKLLRLCVSHLSPMFNINNIESRTSNREVISLLDCDVPGDTETRNPLMYSEQLKVLFPSDGMLEHSSSTNEIFFKQREENQERVDVSSDHHGRLDSMIKANVVGFSVMDKETTPLDCSLVGNSGLVKRR